MKQSSIWLGNIFLLFILFYCKKEDNKIAQKDLTIEIDSYKRVDYSNAYCTLLVGNQTNTNYVLHGVEFIYITHTKGGIISYDDVGKIEGKIVNSDFIDLTGSLSDQSVKIQQTISKYINFKKNKINFPDCYFSDFDKFSHQLLFVPKNSKMQITVWFNAQNINKQTLKNKEKKIISPGFYDSFTKEEIRFLDSLLLKDNLNYKTNKKQLSVKDSLSIED